MNTIRNICEEIEKTKNDLSKELRLIASANYASPSVIKAIGSLATNIFAEGSINCRYVGGSEAYNDIEAFAIEKAKQVFNTEYANVQLLSGAMANYAIYFALLEPGDTVLSMDLTSGGHLSHGANFNISGKLYSFIHYNTNAADDIDYEQIETLAVKHKPKMIIAGSSSYPRIIDTEQLRKIADTCGAYLHFDAAHYVGLIAAGFYPNPLQMGADTMSFSTYKTLRGPRGGCVLSRSSLAKKIERTIFPGLQSGPNEASILGIAVTLEESGQPEFKRYIGNTIQNAKTVAAALQNLGYKVVTSGTDTHLVLVDLSKSTNEASQLTGADVEERCRNNNITLNKNLIPGDRRIAKLASGFRIGMQAMTSRNIHTEHAIKIAEFIDRSIKISTEKTQDIVKLQQEIESFCNSFPII